MFEQYHQLKAQQPDALLMYRMGDFYELFFDDAVVASKVLDITLTSRNRSDPDAPPMAGVPHHSVAGYIERLIEAGHRVAIAEQMEDPGSTRGLVKRAIVRVVTPGVTYDPAALEADQAARLAAVCRVGGDYGLAFLDVSTGELRATVVDSLQGVRAEFWRLEPREVLLGPGAQALSGHGSRGGLPVGTVESFDWSEEEARGEVRAVLGVDPEGTHDAGLRSAGAVLRYARERVGGTLGNVHGLERYAPAQHMVIDEATQRNLELRRTLIGGRRRGSLLGLLDRTATGMGARRLADWMAFPLLHLQAIRHRQGAVRALVEAPDVREELRTALGEVADIERIGARVAQGTAHARDLAALRQSLLALPRILAALEPLPALGEHRPVDPCPDVAEDLLHWLVDEPPLVITEGGLIRAEADSELQELTRLSADGLAVMGELEAFERQATGIPDKSLKIKRNRVFGYFIEVTAAHLHRVPADRYLRKQTLAGCERYVTEELKELEEKVLGADERRRALELERFRELRGRVAEASERLLALARTLAGLDALAALAEVAVKHQWVLPTCHEERRLRIAAGRHPMVEAALTEDRFVPNDVLLDGDERRLIVLTGPNMSGKSTVLRQTAIIVLLAQMGSYVPADEAEIGLCDRIFTRVGAADDLRQGQSTFMVEMSETASILSHATARSLVVLDEIGRGTSTFDGLAIAWAVAEDLVDRIGCQALFATHYHELCELAELRGAVVNESVAVTEVDGDIIFLRRLKPGGASRSYGIQCARLAGLPQGVLDRATALLRHFEKGAPEERLQLPLFGGPAAEPAEETSPLASELTERLRALDPDALTPRQALDALYELRAMLD